MTHALVIAVFVVAFAADGIAPASGVARGWHLAWVAGGFGVVAWIGHLRATAAARRFAATGRGRWVARAERAASRARLAAVGWHGATVLGMGSLDGWRSLFGPAPALGDAVVVALPLSVFAATLWSGYPLERAVRRATGDAAPAVPSRGASVWGAFRQQVLFIAVPLSCIYAWGLVVSWAWARWSLPGAGTLESGAHFAGAIAVFVFIPLAMRWVLDAVPLPAGPVREALVGLGAAHGVHFRDVLIWRTGGSQINGAVMGLAAPVRYVLLTDALLATLPAREIEGVMAHEVAHVRRHHIFWLGVTVVAAVALIGTPLGWLSALAGGTIAGPLAAEGAALLVTLAGALAALGFVSRRFEWQADAFAAKHLAGWRGRRGGPVVITPEAAGTMAYALERVGALNGIERDAGGWRHGSIATRAGRLRALAGRRSDRLSIDREVVVVKAAAAVALGVGSLLVLAEASMGLAAAFGGP